MDDQDGAGFAARYYAEVPVEHRDAGTLCDLASARFYAERTSTLDSVENASANAMFVAGVSSGPLASSWSKVERALLLSRHATGKRYQTRTEREEPTKYTYVEKTLMRFDPTLGEFRPVPYQEIADGALDSLRHRQAHKSRPIKTKWTTAEYCPAAALRITHPRGGAREWSGDTSDRDYQAWLESGDYASLLAFQKSLPTSYPRSL